MTNFTKGLMNLFGWDILNHPAYSTDLAPSDFHLFTFLKTHIAGKFYEERIKKLNGISIKLHRMGRQLSGKISSIYNFNIM